MLGGLDDRLAEIDNAIKVKQAKLLEADRDEERTGRIGDEIIRLRDERQEVMTKAAMRHDLQDRLDDLASFLDVQTEAVAEYDEALVRRLIDRIVIFDEKIEVEFKSGLKTTVEAQALILFYEESPWHRGRCCGFFCIFN